MRTFGVEMSSCEDKSIHGTGDDSTSIATDLNSESILENQLKQAAQSSKQEEERLQDEAHRLTRKARRLRERVEALESQSKRLRSHADDASRLHNSLQFEALCLALRRNDSSITEIGSGSHNVDDFPVGYAQALGQAIVHNTHVSTMDINLDQSVLYGVDDDSYSETNMRNQVASLVQFIESSDSLRCVNFHKSNSKQGANVNGVLVQLYLGACFRNGNIETLRIMNQLETIPAQVFDYGPYSQSLTTLAVHWHSSAVYTQQERQVIGRGFRYFSALKILELGSADSLLLQEILSGLRHGACKLDHFMFACDGDGSPALWTAFSRLLRSMAVLEHLILRYVSFTLQSANGLVHSLKQSADASTHSSPTTVSKLSFWDCTFDVRARRLLRDFMHTKVEDDVADPNDKQQQHDEYYCGISTLEIACRESRRNDFSSRDLISMLRVRQEEGEANDAAAPEQVQRAEGTEPTFYNTIGSQIQSLSLHVVVPGFIRLLSRHSDRISLTSLRVATSDDADIASLAQCISQMPSLDTLHVCNVDGSSLDPLLVALKENRNLYSIAIDDTEENAKLAKAYGERNQFLSALLLDATRNGQADDDETNGNDIPEVVVQHFSITNDSSAHASFGPALLQVATQLPQSRSSHVLRSLSRLRESIGY